MASALQKLRAELDRESMVPTQECVAEVGDAVLARIDALAAHLGVSRDEVLARCVARGLDEIEAIRKPSGGQG